MSRRVTVLICLLFSGLAALIYQVIWTRLLGLTFGHTTEAIGTVLAVFFGGMALGNALAAKLVRRVTSPLRLYAGIEIGIGLYAVLSLPALRNLDALYGTLGAESDPFALAAIRFGLSVALLLPPTIAMGATLPLVARGIVERDETLGRWSALLYGANTGGAVLGAYLAGFWMIPSLGLSGSAIIASACNGLVGAVILGSRAIRTLRWPTQVPPPPQDREPERMPMRGLMLGFFGISGFVAIGYELLWTKLLGIVMEGTLYGYATVLSVFLLGLTLGSLAMAPFVDRIRHLTRAFGLLHLGIAASVALGAMSIPYLPHAYQRLAALGDGIDAVHLFFLLALPLILVPTLLFGAAFPILIRIYTGRATTAGRGIGLAGAVNTTGGILASLVVGFGWIPAFGMDSTLLLLLLLQVGMGLSCLMLLRGGASQRRPALVAGSAIVALAILGGFKGLHVDAAIVGRGLGARPDVWAYRGALHERLSEVVFRREGRSSVVTVHRSRTGRVLQNNGLTEAGVAYAPPFGSAPSHLLGIIPYVLAESPRRVLVIGLGGARTLEALVAPEIERVDVVELEPGVIEALPVLFEGLPHPLADPRVHLRIGDGRHALLRGRAPGAPRYDIIASQPSHPWIPGSANLFTEEYFELARANLTDDGLFALWVNGFRTDAESLLAIVTSFDRVFPGSVLFEVQPDLAREAFLLLGSKRGIEIDGDTARARLQTPSVWRLANLHGLSSLEELLSLIEGPAAPFASIQPDARNTDDNAFVETRIPRLLEWKTLYFPAIEERLPADAALLPPARGEIDIAGVARALLERGGKSERWPYGPKLRRLLQQHPLDDSILHRVILAEASLRDPENEAAAARRLRSLARHHPGRSEALVALAAHLQSKGRAVEAAESYQAAYGRSGDPEHALRALELLYEVDRPGAYRLLSGLPPEARGAFPRLSLYDALATLDHQADGRTLGDHYDRILAFRDTRDGRTHPRTEDALARLADALGRTSAARAHRDLDLRARTARAQTYLSAAETALEADDLSEVRSALTRVEALLPASLRAAELRARVALAEDNAPAFGDAMRRVRSLTPTIEGGITIENRLRAEHALPLLPQTTDLGVGPSSRTGSGGILGIHEIRVPVDFESTGD